MSTIGCVFCGKVGNVSCVNQHIRSFQDASRTSRHARGSDHHHIEIVQAFYSQTAKPQPEFIQATSADRLAVLNEFASSITKHLKSDSEAEKWRKRDFYPRRATWWGRQITIVQDMYCASGRHPQLLSAHVKNIIDNSITESLLNADDADNDDDEPHLSAHIPRKLDAGRSQLLAMASASGAFMPAPQNDLNMQYTGSQHGSRIEMDANITNKPTKRWFNNLSTADNNAAAGPSSGPKIHLRKRGNSTFDNTRAGSTSRSTEYVTISDEEQDDHDYDQAGTPPASIQPSKRGKNTATGRAASSTVPSSRITAKEARSVSDGAVLSSRPQRAASPDGMAPFLILHVTGLTNTVNTIPISYGTTMDQALALALRFAPRVVRENNVPVTFFGDTGSHWEGDWPECRWDSVMDSAMTQRVEVSLRLIMLE